EGKGVPSGVGQHGLAAAVDLVGRCACDRAKGRQRSSGGTGRGAGVGQSRRVGFRERHEERVIQTAIPPSYERVEINSRDTVVADHFDAITCPQERAVEVNGADVKVLPAVAIAVRAEEEAVGGNQPTRPGGNESVDEGPRGSPGGALVTQHRPVANPRGKG